MRDPARKKTAKGAQPSTAKKPATRGSSQAARRAGQAAKPAPAVKKAAAKKAAKKTSPKAAPRKPAATSVAARRPGGRAKASKAAAVKRPLEVANLDRNGRHDGPDPEGFFVARVRGEDAAREAPHQLLEPGGWEEEPAAPPPHDEGLGELPWTYGDDLLVALPRDPRTLFVYWDQARASVDAAFAGVPGARAQLWIFARGQAWDRVRTIDVALEARGWYVHELEPGRAYRAELHVVGSDGQDRLLPGPSLGAALPPVGMSGLIDDRFATLPWDVPLPKLMGPGFPGGPFSEEARALLARLSGWDRFGHSGAGGPTSPPGGPGGPSSPSRPFGGEGR